MASIILTMITSVIVITLLRLLLVLLIHIFLLFSSTNNPDVTLRQRDVALRLSPLATAPDNIHAKKNELDNSRSLIRQTVCQVLCKAIMCLYTRKNPGYNATFSYVFGVLELIGLLFEIGVFAFCVLFCGCFG